MHSFRVPLLLASALSLTLLGACGDDTTDNAADKVVYSSTLDTTWTKRTRLERSFDPTAIEAMKASTDRDLAIGGPTLAAHAFAAGLVDVIHVLIAPVIVGAGKAGLPVDRLTELQLTDHRTFADGAAYLRYTT
jgi:dihydrofolate reductase